MIRFFLVVAQLLVILIVFAMLALTFGLQVVAVDRYIMGAGTLVLVGFLFFLLKVEDNYTYKCAMRNLRRG